LSQLAEICVAKAKTWDQRSKVRADELSALTAAVEIIKNQVAEKTSDATVRLAQQGAQVYVAHALARNEHAMEALEAAAEEADAAPGFLQRKQVTEHASSPDAQTAVINMLKADAGKYKSTVLMNVANRVKADPLGKVKKLIQDLIERLLHEAAEEANQKGWCDKAQADAKQKRDYAAESIAELNSELAGLEATRNKLVEELGIVGQEIVDLEDKMEEAKQMREDEQAKNAATITEAEAGLDATNMAIDILDKFYKTAGKAEVDLSLAQKGPLDDMPDTGFDAGEAYTGAGGEAGGILGMLDVIKSDFQRTISATEVAEREAKEEYLDFETQSGKSLAEKKMADEQKTKQKDNALEKLESAITDFGSQSEILNLAIKELIELKPTCVDTGMSYEDRVARREDEIESLKKALCIFQAYAEYGPEGAGNEC
jgi:chromosome segregation ATPase